MGYWTFTSDNEWFRFSLPDNWSEYDDGDDETYAFFNTEKWSGNLRITPFKWTEDNVETVDHALISIEDELIDNPKAELSTISGMKAAFYVEENDDDLVVCFWKIGTGNTLFICTFAFDKEFVDTLWHNTEKAIVTEMLNSIEIL